MDTTTGVVETTWGDGAEFKFKVDGVYFSNKFKTPPAINKGDTVEIQYQHNPEYKGQFWKSVKVLGASTSSSPSAVRTTGFPVPYHSDKRAIIRQNALTNAVNFCSVYDTDSTPEDVIKIAMKFEEYTSGDLDVAIKKEMESSEPMDIGEGKATVAAM